MGMDIVARIKVVIFIIGGGFCDGWALIRGIMGGEEKILLKFFDNCCGSRFLTVTLHFICHYVALCGL